MLGVSEFYIFSSICVDANVTLGIGGTAMSFVVRNNVIFVCLHAVTCI